MPAARPRRAADVAIRRGDRDLVATFEHHGYETVAEASALVVVREATAVELQSAWTTYQLNRGRGWN